MKRAMGSILRRWADLARSRMRVAALVAILGASPPVFANGSDDAHEYRLAPGDRITVTVFGQPELSGEILVEGGGDIALPFIGSIAVKNMTVIECQKAIADRLADGVLAKPAVNVRLGELRPLYILGDVRTSGAYPFRYGSTVKSAVAAAGGFRLADSAQSAALAEFLSADERLRILSLQRRSLIVRRARIEAQRDSADKFIPPTIPDVKLDNPDAALDNEVADAVEMEKQTFDSEAVILNSQVDLLRSQKPRLDNEIRAVSEQIDTEKKKIQIIQQQEDQYSGLVKQGLGLVGLNAQLKLDETSRESDMWRLSAEVVRLQMEKGDLNIKIQEVEATFKKQIIADLQDARQRLRELDISLKSAREMRELKRQLVDSAAGADVAYLFNITRAQNGNSAVLEATASTPLEPGDIVEVKPLSRGDPLHQNAANSSETAKPISPVSLGRTTSK